MTGTYELKRLPEFREIVEDYRAVARAIPFLAEAVQSFVMFDQETGTFHFHQDDEHGHARMVKTRKLSAVLLHLAHEAELMGTE